MRKSAQPEDSPAGEWDVVVIGGGPAGMMAAGRAAERGARVILLEKNASLGRKLLITGGGRCNVTNAELDTRMLLAKFKESGKFLFSPFSEFAVKDTLDFFHTRGMPTKEEAGQRVFPLANTAHAVWDVLVDYMRESGVEVMLNAPVKKVIIKDGRIDQLELKGSRTIRARSYILATGGKSHPETGSTGDGYAWLRELGHKVVEEGGALVPIRTVESWGKRAAGVALKDAKITLYQNEVKQSEQRGKVLFTHVGLSGPGILNMSREIGELLKYGPLDVELDLLPHMGYEKVNAALQSLLKEHHTKKIKNALDALVSPALCPVVLQLAEIDADTPCNSVKREQRIRLMKILKHIRMGVKDLLGMDKAVITAGGVDLAEVDFKTMRSRKCDNLYLVGDILNIERPSGGYSLQLCWTTGFVAGSSAAHTKS